MSAIVWFAEMIVSRAAELGRLDELLDSLRTGHGRALVVHGDPGIGKTTLLDALADRCDDDVLVLRARGVETEAELAFAALSDLLTPVAGAIGQLPTAQSAALAAALALGPPAPGDRLAVCVATLGLLRAVAADRPVVAIVDDLQWLDAASRECVLYVARRATGSLALVLAARDPWDPALERAGLPGLELAPLHADAARELLRRVAPDLAPAAAAALIEAAAGNPLALVELPAALTADQRSGVSAPELPVVPGSRLHSSFAARLDELDPLARSALVVAATHAGDDLTAISAACRAADIDVGRLAEAETRGLVKLGDGRVIFAHPLVRAAAYHAADPAERRRAHAALAAVLGGERRVWHRAAATAGTDEDVAAALERAGADAAARRGFAAAAAALERAARLSPQPEAAARRLLAAGQSAAAAGARERALGLLGEAARATRDPGLRARSQQLRGRIMVWSGSPVDATRLLVAEAERCSREDPALAAEMLADAANACTVTNSHRRSEALACRAVALLGDDGEPEARGAVLAMLGWALVLRGKAPLGRPVLGQAEQLAAGLDPLGPHWPWLHLLLLARIPLGELERARSESADLCERARDAGALATLGGTLIVACEVAFRLGDWDAAEAAAGEAIRVAGDTGQHAWHGYGLTLSARIAGARGRAREARAAGEAALAIADAAAMRSGQRFGHAALGFVALSSGRTDEAIAELETVERIVADSGLGDPTLVPWAPDLIEAYVRAGRSDGARRVLGPLERQAASAETAFALAVTARCRCMLDDDFDRAFAEAMATDAQRPLPFERARAQLAYGRRLHRARRRADAREHLREALAGFERLGAAPWAAQARNELRAAGARRRARRDGALTPQEQRVAAAVRRGASNREIAAELFLAPKTIEFHLHQIYRKLDVHSRSQLVATLGQADPPDLKS